MNARVLLVEDDLIAAETAALVLRRAGHEVVGVAGSYERALAIATSMHPELALVDIGLGGETAGIELANRLREVHDIAVIFVTGHNEPEVIERATLSLPYGYLLKPFDARTLEAGVEIALARRRADAAVREQGQWLASLLRGIGAAVIATDLAGNLRFLNPTAATLLGTATSSNAPVSDWLVLRQDARDLPVDPVAESLARAETTEFPPGTSLVRRDGRRIPVEGSVSPLGSPSGGTRGAVITFRDVSDRVEAERARLQSERIAALGTLASGIAHDFNNMLTVIMSSACLGRKALEHDESLARLFDDIQNTCDRASALTSELMAFAKGGTRARHAAAVAPLVEEAVSLALRGSGTRAVFELPDDLWPWWIDAAQVSQVFVNLALNSRDAMGGRGRIDVAAANRNVGPDNASGLPEGRYVEVQVRDRGEGIPEDQLSRVFEPYFSTKSTGKGLGLASAHGIVERHGGALGVSSRVGQGTTFSVLLPAVEVEQTVKDPPPVAAAIGGISILVMDDEAALRRVLGMCLRELGHRVELTASGEEAVEAHRRAIAEGRRFDLVILDLTVPGGMGGVAALEEMRRLDPSVVAIATTGYSDSEVLDDFERHGFSAALPKPYRFGTLALALREAVRADTGAGSR